jgi:hypothetical protein
MCVGPGGNREDWRPYCTLFCLPFCQPLEQLKELLRVHEETCTGVPCMQEFVPVKGVPVKSIPVPAAGLAPLISRL